MTRLSLLVALLLFVSGCGGGPGSPVPAASYDPESATRKAFEDFDKDRDGFLTAAELDAAPGIRAALARADANKDKKISRDELKARFQAYSGAATAVTCSVTLAGSPVAGAEVAFTPEPCMGDSVQGGKGTTDASGMASITRADGVPGLSTGMYRVTVTGGGVPADYASRPLLGHEVATDARGGGDTIELRLVAKPR